MNTNRKQKANTYTLMNIKNKNRQNYEHKYNKIKMGDYMKKILYLTLLLILLPILPTIIIKPLLKDIQENKYKIQKNTQVRVKRNETNKIETIELEEYLIGVLAGEMPVSYNIEALKAQAVAARTYTLKKMETNKNNTYDVIDTTDDQVYLDENKLKQTWGTNYEQYIKKIKQAITETKGEYLTYNGKIIKAFFFSTSSGQTENCYDVFEEDLPYLISVSSTWDETSPSYLSEKEFSKKEFYEQLELPYQEELDIQIERNPSNSINTIKINNNTLKGTEFRRKLNIRSTTMDIEQTEEKITIKSKGFGHGVGMSQYGAGQLANNGYKYNEILKYYYQGIEIKKI